jgi:hypothetical protein
MRIFIAGDSFAADWSVKYQHYPGWCNILQQHTDLEVNNIAQAGVSEYKILRQISSVDLDQYDLAIVCHTLPSRITTIKHPIHAGDLLHGSADLIFSDLEHHAKLWHNAFNRALHSAKDFFKYHYDQECQDTVYRLLRQECALKLKTLPFLVVNFSLETRDFVLENHVLDFCLDSRIKPGLINHMDAASNRWVADAVLDWINTKYSPKEIDHESKQELYSSRTYQERDSTASRSGQLTRTRSSRKSTGTG